MKARLLNLWDRFRGSFWFLPTILILLAVASGVVVPELDEATAGSVGRARWLASSPEGARTILSVIAGAMITVAGVVLSVTMVALSIASSQFGSRVLRSSMRNRAAQLAIGAFLATSVYCFLVLRTIGQPGEGTPVPHLSVTLGIGLAVVSLLILVYFIHEVAQGIQAPHIVASLAYDLDGSIDRLFPEKIGEGNDAQEEARGETQAGRLGVPARVIHARGDGYLQAVDGEGLIAIAGEHDLVIGLQKRPGDFVAAGDPIADVWAGGGGLQRFDRIVNDALILGNIRTPRQDVNCTIHELAQVAVRALSPGINDPYTAMNCLDRLSAALGRLAERERPGKFRCDADGRLRLIADPAGFAEALSAAFDQIRHEARNCPAVAMRLLEGLESIAHRLERPEDQSAVLRHAEKSLETMKNVGHLESEMEAMGERCARVRAACSPKPGDRPGISGL